MSKFIAFDGGYVNLRYVVTMEVIKTDDIYEINIIDRDGEEYISAEMFNTEEEAEEYINKLGVTI